MLPPNPSNKPPDGDNTPPNPQPDWQRWIWPAFVLLLLVTMFLRLPGTLSSSANQAVEVPYSFFVQQAKTNNVETAVFENDTISGNFRQPVSLPASSGTQASSRTVQNFITIRLPVDDPGLVETLVDNDVIVEAETTQSSPILLFLLNFAPILLLVGFLIWSARRAQGQMTNVFGFGRSQARQYDAEKPSVTFEDVAGQDAAKNELVEIVDFLKDPDKYIVLGARIPRGVLLIGPPGTGKTLMARAVAGEANVPFFSMAASEFVEMFVGVGASRVRDLFNRAKAVAPSIVFIDEIDAVGRHRGAGLGGGHDEREQTLNQLLAEMDGFDQSSSVIIMAATNRPDVLDPALLRPGRFDRQVTVDLPDKYGRLHILEIHTRDKPLSSDVELESLARATIGFSGADLANLANEAALTAARKLHKRIIMSDFSAAFERIILGTERPPLSNETERIGVAFHEAGHALVAALTPEADPVLKVTIVPRGRALGITAFSPKDDRRNLPRSYIQSQMYVLLGGRAAEEVAIGEVTTGASDDLRRATEWARRMVTQFGMSDAFGPLNFGDDDHQPFLGYSLSQGRHFSEETAARIDVEVRRIVEEAHEHAVNLIDNNREKLEALAQELLDQEVVEGTRVLEILEIEDTKSIRASDDGRTETADPPELEAAIIEEEHGGDEPEGS